MSWQLLLTIIGASTGFVAGIWFCIDAISMTRSRIAKVCDNSWAADPGTAEALAAQSGEYLAGGVLLIMTFVLQMAAKHASPIPDQTLCSCLACLFALGFFCTNKCSDFISNFLAKKTIFIIMASIDEINLSLV
jgi:hypothetical protein